jgi:hypothetical protein
MRKMINHFQRYGIQLSRVTIKIVLLCRSDCSFVYFEKLSCGSVTFSGLLCNAIVVHMMADF